MTWLHRSIAEKCIETHRHMLSEYPLIDRARSVTAHQGMVQIKAEIMPMLIDLSLNVCGQSEGLARMVGAAPWRS